MAKVQMKLDKEDSGLPGLAARLAAAPHSRRLALVVCDCSRIEKDLDTGAEIATIRISKLEAVRDEDLNFAVEMLKSAHSSRVWTSTSGSENPDVFPKGTVIDVHTGEILYPYAQSDPTLFEVVPGSEDDDDMEDLDDDEDDLP